MKTLQIMIMPSFDTTREAMGIEEYEDYDTDSILYQQGYDAEVIIVEDDEIFEIEEGYIGRIFDEDEDEDEDEDIEVDDELETAETELYLIRDLEDLNEKYEYVLEGDLDEGRYQFLAKHNAILFVD
jgi:hypothetical protein